MYMYFSTCFKLFPTGCIGLTPLCAVLLSAGRHGGITLWVVAVTFHWLLGCHGQWCDNARCVLHSDNVTLISS